MNTNTYRINNEILCDSVTIIDTKQKLEKKSALELAIQQNLDLVELSVNNNVSYCKITNYDKFLYEKKKELKKREKIQKENQIELKEVQLRPVTALHDIEIKAKKTLQFIQSGCRIKLLMRLKNREISHKEVAVETINKFLSFIKPEFIEKHLYNEGQNLVVILFKPRTKTNVN